MGRPDQQEVEDLYRKYGALVRRRAHGILGNEADAGDAMQEVFVRVINALSDFRRQSQPSTWLYRITTNLCLNRLRDARRRAARVNQGAAPSIAGPTGTSATPATDPETRAILRNLLGQLPENLCEAAIYHFVDGMDQAEIAHLAGVSRRTIGYRLERFARAAGRILQRDGIAPERVLGGRKGEREPKD